MALPIRRSAEQAPQVPAWAPLGEIEGLTRQLSRLIDDTFGAWGSPFWSGALHVPFGDVEEQDDAYVVSVELPGVNKNDIDVEVAGRTLRVHAERKEVERKGILRKSTRRTGEFHYETLLPGDIDEASVEAAFEDGVLAVRLPKPEAERHAARKIAVK